MLREKSSPNLFGHFFLNLGASMKRHQAEAQIFQFSKHFTHFFVIERKIVLKKCETHQKLFVKHGRDYH